MCCLLQYTLYGKIIKRKTRHKSKDKPWKEKLHELSITFCDTCFYCFDLMLRKILIPISKGLVREYKCYQNHGISCTFTLTQSTKNMTFHAYIVRVQVLISYVNTRLQRIFSRFCQKVSVWVLFLIRAMFWDTSKDVWQCENLGFYFAHCTMMEFYT